MQAFNQAYPYIVLTVGLVDAAVAALFGFGLALVILTGWLDSISDKIAPAVFVCALLNLIAVAILAATHWLLMGV